MSFQITSFINTTSPYKLICIPGWGYSFEINNKFLEIAKQQFSIYIIDLPGYNKSKTEYKSLSITNISNELKETLDNLKIDDNTIVLCHSMGSLLIMPLIELFPNTKFILTGCPIESNYPISAKILSSWPFINIILSNRIFINSALDLTQKIIAKRINSKGIKYIGDIDKKSALLYIKAIAHFNTLPFIQTLKERGNIYLFYGQNDHHKYLAEKNDIKYIEIPNTGHTLMENDPNTFTEYVRKIFMNQLSQNS